MKTKLKILSLLLAALCLCAALSACAKPAEPEGEAPQESEASETEESESSEPAPEESAESEAEEDNECEPLDTDLTDPETQQKLIAAAESLVYPLVGSTGFSANPSDAFSEEEWKTLAENQFFFEAIYYFGKNENPLYPGFSQKNEETLYYEVSTQKAHKLIAEVLGDECWIIPSTLRDGDQEEETYSTGLEFGIGYGWFCSEVLSLEADFENLEIIVAFLAGRTPYTSDESKEGKAVFSIRNNSSGAPYLRCESIMMGGTEPKLNPYLSESSGAAEDILLAEAEALSKYIIGIVSKSDLKASSLSEKSFDERQFNLFVLLHAGRAWEDPSDIYRSSFYKTSDGFYHFPKDAVQKMMFEVFGIKDLIPLFAEDDQFEENEAEYLSTLEFGFGPILSFKNLEAEFFGENIEVCFTLTDNLGFEGEPGWEEHGEYKIIFDIIEENGISFLRFKSLIKEAL